MPTGKFYAVQAGRQIGVYRSWEEARRQVDGYRNASFKKFSTKAQAEQFAFGNGGARVGGGPAADDDRGRDGRVPPAVRGADAGDRRVVSPLPPRGEEPYVPPTYVLYFDGAARGNPGPAGGGAILLDEHGTEVGSISANWPTSLPHVMGDAPSDAGSGSESALATEAILQSSGSGQSAATNNQAEYLGLVAGLCLVRDAVAFHLLRDAKGLSSIEEAAEIFSTGGASTRPMVDLARLEVRGDSRLVVEQMRGGFECRGKSILRLHARALELMDRLWAAGVHCDPTREQDLKQVPRARNGQADRLANIGVELRGETGVEQRICSVPGDATHRGVTGAARGGGGR